MGNGVAVGALATLRVGVRLGLISAIGKGVGLTVSVATLGLMAIVGSGVGNGIDVASEAVGVIINALEFGFGVTIPVTAASFITVIGARAGTLLRVLQAINNTIGMSELNRMTSL